MTMMLWYVPGPFQTRYRGNIFDTKRISTKQETTIINNITSGFGE